MKKFLRPSTQYKKDLKRIRHNPKKSQALLDLLKLLENNSPIPKSYRPHTLVNDYPGCIECHVLNDLLLIWYDPETGDIDLLRLGSHSELFGKGPER